METSPIFSEERIQELINESMVISAINIQRENDSRISMGNLPIIDDQVEFDAWLKGIYDAKDANIMSPKPPSNVRQLARITPEHKDEYKFTRYQDQWGHRWHLELWRANVTALAIAIYDAGGNYLYTTGALIDTGNGSWYTECPAGQADTSPEDVYYKWLLGSANISDLENYKGSESTKEGFVRSDERYD